MAVNPDFRDLFSALNAAEVRYLVVGAYAVTFHARPRFTKDLDVWCDPAADNAERLWLALRDFGAPLGDLTPEAFRDPELVYQIGVAPNRIDILFGLSDLRFDEAWSHRVETTYGAAPIQVLSREDLIRNKRASGRPQDLEDLRALEAERDDPTS